jgi:membrane dipeptidase
MTEDHLDRARRLHQNALVIDSHCDTTRLLMKDDWDFAQRHEDDCLDIPRLREGGVSAVFMAVFAPPPVEPGAGIAAARAQIDRIHETVRRYEADLALARTADEVRQAAADGRIALLIGIEGGYLIEDSLEVLREFHERGATYLTLTHASHTTWADSSGVHEPLDPLHGGLTEFGREVVRELNRLGMMVDVSHVSDDTFRDVLDTSTAPVVATHSSCRARSPHRRNMTDDMMRALAGTGGVVQINFAAAFIDPEYPQIGPEERKQWFTPSGDYRRDMLPDHVTPLSILADHFDHALKVVGPAHVGIGSDFDGTAAVPADLEDCSKLPHLTAELLRRGYTEEALALVLGENLLRVMDACRRHAGQV